MRPCFATTITIAVLSLSGVGTSCHALDSAALEFATGNRTQVLRIAGHFKSPFQFSPSPSSKIDLVWDVSLAYWRMSREHNIPDNSASLVDLGLTPAFRWIAVNDRGLFGEAGIGLHGFSRKYDNNGRTLLTLLQFGSHLGLGYAFDNTNSLSLRIAHFSNGGVKKPNNGVNFVGLRFGRTF